MFYRFSESPKEYMDFLKDYVLEAVSTPNYEKDAVPLENERKSFANEFKKETGEKKIKLPCYPGDTVYYTNKEKNTITSLKVDSIVITKDSTDIICSKPLFNFLSNETTERYSFKIEEDFGTVLFNNLTFGVAYENDAVLASFEFNCNSKNSKNVTAELHVLLNHNHNLPVKFVVQLSDGKSYQAFLFDDISKAEKKFNEIKTLFTSNSN